MGAAVNKLFDLVMQVEHSHPDSIVIVTGDFSKANLKKEMPKFIQQVTCATRYGRTFDYCYNLTIVIQPTFKGVYKQHLKYAKQNVRTNCVTVVSEYGGDTSRLF